MWMIPGNSSLGGLCCLRWPDWSWGRLRFGRKVGGVLKEIVHFHAHKGCMMPSVHSLGIPAWSLPTHVHVVAPSVWPACRCACMTVHPHNAATHGWAGLLAVLHVPFEQGMLGISAAFSGACTS